MSKNLIVFDQHPVFLDFASNQLQVRFDPATARTVSHVRQNDDDSFTILAVVVVTNWTEHSVELSIASTPGLWATRRYIRDVYEYIFGHCGKTVLYAVVETSNAAAITLHERIGHKYVGRMEDWFGEDRPVVLYTLTKRDYQKGKWSSTKGRKE